MKTLFTDAHLVSAGVDLPHAAVLIDGEFVAAVLDGSAPRPAADRVIDLGGAPLLPGFIDIHCHGRSGSDFTDATDAAIERIAVDKLSEGVTTMLCTTLTVSRETIAETLAAAARYAKDPAGARIAGAHLEGPFFNPEGAGAQNPDFLLAPDAGLVGEWNRIFPVRKVSLSPELPGAMEFIAEMKARGIVTSGAHSTADYDTFQRARAAGMTHLTHFCNVMTPLHHLRPGMVGGGLLAPEVLTEIIGDGVHLSDPMLEVILRLKGGSGAMLITDAMRAAGMPEGNYTLGGLAVIVRDHRATLADGKTVAGGISQYFEGVRRLRSLGVLPDRELIRIFGYNQAVSLGLDRVGEIREGWFADLVVADDDWQPRQVWCRGVPRM